MDLAGQHRDENRCDAGRRYQKLVKTRLGGTTGEGRRCQGCTDPLNTACGGGKRRARRTTSGMAGRADGESRAVLVLAEGSQVLTGCEEGKRRAE